MGSGVFDVLSEQDLMRVLRAQAERPEQRNDDQWALAVDLLEGKQLEHTEQALRDRYTERQKLASGQKIQPLTFPLTERYVAEAANAYNKPVKRTLINEDDSTNEEATKIYEDAAGEVGLDESMHALERHTVLLDTAVLWARPKRGEISTQIITPQRIHPVLPMDSQHCDYGDQRDYMGHVVELETGETPASEREFAFITAAAHYYYRGTDWSEPKKLDIRLNEELTWPQAEDTEDYQRKIEDLPLQLLTYWHRVKPVGKLIPPTDCPIATMNIELNVQWSAIMDTLRKQGWGQTFIQTLDASKPPAQVSMGSGFAVSLGPEESIGSFGHGNDYTGMVELLKTLSKFFAILLRQSPNDFAMEGASIASGFAKLVDSLPKIEARTDRIRRLKSMEERYLWPRLGSTLIYLDQLGEDAKKLRCRVEYADVEFPRTIDERTKEEDHEIKLGLTTPAQLMAKDRGITEEEAQVLIDENKGKAPEPEKQPDASVAPQPGRDAQDIVSRIVARRNGLKPEKKEEPDAKPST